MLSACQGILMQNQRMSTHFNANLAHERIFTQKRIFQQKKRAIFLHKIIKATKRAEILDDIQYFNRQTSKVLRFSKRYYLLSHGMIEYCSLPDHPEPRLRFYILVGLLSEHGIYNTYYSQIAKSDSFKKIVKNWDSRRQR